MTFAPVRNRRQMLPRWRPIAKTVASGELAMPRRHHPSLSISPELRVRLERWRLRRDSIGAAELVETALVENQEREAVEAARALIAKNSTATPLVRRQAALLLERAGLDEGQRELMDQLELSPAALARKRTRMFPHDAYAWTDLALAHVNRGKDYDAKRSMQVALQLAPNDRHVLRSAARLFLHLDDPEQAYELIKNSRATPYDPWLMAGEIAISASAERSPAFFKAGIKLIDERRALPKHFSELAGAIGTIHLCEGNRRARKLFLTSLIDPTGNALAQAEWASPHIGNLVTPQTLAQVEDSAEANAFQAYWAANFEDVIKWCEAWHVEEPFSSRPQQFGAHAANVTDQFDLALKFAEEGLKANPNAPTLYNSKAFALISLARYEEALPTVRYCLETFPEESVVPLIATAGLMALRLGQISEGTKRYREAISLFKRRGAYNNEALALAYFAREAARAELPDASKILEEAREACQKARFLPEAGLVLQRAEAWLKVTAMRREPATAIL